MKKVLIFALIVAFLSVVAFADELGNNSKSVNLSMTIGTAVQLEMGEIDNNGEWIWNPDVAEAIPSDVLTADVTIKTNTKFRLTGAFTTDATHFGDIIVQNVAGTKGIKVLAKLNFSAFGLIDAVDSDVFTYAELVGVTGTGMATGELQFSLESFGENFSWYDVEAGTQTPVQYVATIAPEA